MNEYQKLAIRTAKQINEEFDLFHSALGLAGEAGEFADAVKKSYIYGQTLNRINLLEEIGDVMWYCALACETLGVTMEEVAKLNIDKLKRRYPEKYEDYLAKARLDKEGEE